MDQGLIPRRYAKALYLHAVERHCDRPLYEVMRRLSAAFGREPGLNDALANPFVAYPDKQALVLAAVGGETGKEAEDAAFADFLKLLGQNKRLDMLREIALAYIAIYRKENRIFRVAVTTAAPVSSQDMKRIHALVGKHLPDGASAEYTEAVDSALIGGFTVAIDNERLDASVANELTQVRLSLFSY